MPSIPSIICLPPSFLKNGRMKLKYILTKMNDGNIDLHSKWNYFIHNKILK